MTTHAEQTLAKMLESIPKKHHQMVKLAFEEGYKEGRRQLSPHEALEECKKWAMTDEELAELEK